MAEIQTSAPVGRGSKPRVKKNAFRLDMTPMVDLAFLLLTFFMLTTTFSKPTVMQLAMPVKGPQTDLPASNSLTLILGKNNQVHYFFGLNAAAEAAELHTTNFQDSGLRQVLLQQKQRNPHTMVLIKDSPDSKYRNLVDALDEMNITGQQKYALVDFTESDRELLKHNAL